MNTAYFSKKHVLLSGLVLLSAGWLLVRCDTEHQQEGAHEHGVVQLNIALDSPTKLGIELRSPAVNIYGFEHAATSDADRATQAAALKKLETGIETLVALDALGACRVTERKVSVEAEEHEDHQEGAAEDHADEHADKHAEDHGGAEHSEVHAFFQVECAQPIAGTGVQVSLGKVFPSITKLRVQVLGDQKQESVTLENGQGQIRL